MLYIWTAAKADLIDRTVGAALKLMRPDVPEHVFIPWSEEAEVPELVTPSVLLACGARPMSTLQRAGIVPKNRTVHSMREKVLNLPLGKAFVTYDPGEIGSDPSKGNLIAWDVRLATRWLNFGTIEPEVGAYKWVSSFQPLIDWIESEVARTNQAVPVSMDLETEGFDPWYPDKDIVSISFSGPDKTADVMYLGGQDHPVQLIANDGTLYQQIEWLLNSPKVRLWGTNLKFDLVWVWVRWKMRCTNFTFDTVLAGSLVDENRSNGLKNHAKLLTTMGGYERTFVDMYGMANMGGVPANEHFLGYAGGDTDATKRSGQVIRRELLHNDRLVNFYTTILHPGARAFERIEERGIYMDVQKMHVLRDDLGKAIHAGHQQCLELLPNRLRTKYRDKIEDQLAAGKSPMLPSLLRDYFFSPLGLNLTPKVVTKKAKEAATSKSHLRMFVSVPDAKAMVAALTDADVASKTRSTFVDGFVSAVRNDGLLHPTYYLAHGEFEGHENSDTGTVSGRLSAKDPPIQIVPKKTHWAQRIRECFTAPPGKVMLIPDYIQGELKTAACIANEKNMIQAYDKGLDLHAVTGAQLGGVSYEEFMTWKIHDDPKKTKMFKDIRDRAKAGNFGLLFGMGVDGFQAYAWNTYGLVLTHDEAKEIRDGFFSMYPGLLSYHDRQRHYVRVHEEVWSPLGRARHLPTIRAWDREIQARAERQAINSPVQSTLTDMLIWSLALIEDAYPNDEIAVVAMIHDAFVAYVDEDKAQLRASQVNEIMSNLPFEKVGWKPQLRFTVEATVGKDMWNQHEIKL